MRMRCPSAILGFGYAVFVIEVLKGSVQHVHFREIYDPKVEGSVYLL